MYFSGTKSRRRYRVCCHCGGPAPPDGIRLRGGRWYCPDGDCQREALELILAARERVVKRQRRARRRKSTVRIA